MAGIRTGSLGLALAWALMVSAAGAHAAPPAKPAAGPAAPALDALVAEATRLTQRGRYKEAEPLFRQALAEAIRQWGERDVRTATRTYELASSLNDLARYAEADQFYRRTYELRAALLGERDRDTLMAFSDIGANLEKWDRPAEAEPFLRRALQARVAAFGENDADVADSAANIGVLLHRQGRYPEAEAFLRQALAINRATKGDRHTETARSASTLGSNLREQGRFAEAAEYHRLGLLGMREALGDDHPDTAISYAELAMNLESMGRNSEAEPLLRKSLDIRRARLGEAHPSTLSAYNTMGIVLIALGRYAEAEAPLRKALEARLRAPGPPATAALSSNNLAFVLLKLGRPDEAERLYRNAIAIWSRTAGATNWRTAAGHMFLGQLLLNQNRLDEAQTELQTAADNYLAAFGPNHPESLRSKRWLAMVLAARGDLDPALAAIDAAARASERNRTLNLAKMAGRADTVGSRDSVAAFGTYLDIAWQVGQAEPQRRTALGAEGFRFGQSLLNSSAGRAMAMASARIAAGGDALALAVRMEQDLTSRAQALDKDLLAALGKGDGARVTALRAEQDASLAKLAEASGTLDTAFPSYRALTAATAIPLAETQALLGKGQGLILLLAQGNTVYSLAVTHDRFAWTQVAVPFAKVAEQMAMLRCHADTDTCTAQQVSGIYAVPASPWERKGYARFDLAVAHQLYKELIAPVEDAFQGSDSLFVTTTSNLANLPLGLLVTRPPRKGADFADPGVLKGAGWMSDRYALTVLPSVSALRLRALGDSPGGAAEPFEGFGDPHLGPPQAVDRGTGRQNVARRPTVAISRRDGSEGFFRAVGPTGDLLADSKQLSGLASLPGTRIELNAMARMFGVADTELTLGDAFTEARFRAAPALRTARVIAIATHGILPSVEASIDEPGLVMTPPTTPSRDNDGVLTASEAASLNLTADWVILSACNTASIEGQDSLDSLSSLSRAFLYAGAKALLASHWRVWDTSTAALTVETLRERQAGRGTSRARALQHAMRAVRTGRRSDGSRLMGWKPEWAHPSAWAAFSNIAYAD